MAVSVNYSAQDYRGIGSNAYAVTFPVDSPSDVWAAVKLDGGEEFTTLPRDQFEVTETEPGKFEVTTEVEYTNDDWVKVYRLLDVIQPFVFPEGGAFPSRDVERALDRLLMLIQQLRLESGLTGATITLPGDAVTVKGVMVVADADERAGAVPDYPGQLLIQLSPQPFTLWIGNPDAQTKWTEFRPAPATMADRLVIAATADAGTPGAVQLAIVTRAADWSADYVICAGDNHYAPATFNDSWAAFTALIAAGKVLPALGNHDTDDWTAHAALFSALPSSPANRRYYKMSLGNGLVDVFVLHSGRDTAWNASEPHGNYPGSIQWKWFKDQLAASTARWRIAVFHHPPVTVCSDSFRADLNLDWPEFARLDGIFCGHVHLTEWLTCRGTPVVNVSGGVLCDGTVDGLLNVTGAEATGSDLLWHDARRQLMAKLIITPQRFLVAYHEILSGVLVYQRDLTDKTAHRHEWGLEIVGPSNLVPLGNVPVGVCPDPLTRGVWVLTVATPGASPLGGTVLVDNVVAANWQIPAGSYWVEVTSSRHVKRGARVKVNVTTNADYASWYGLGCYYRGQITG